MRAQTHGSCSAGEPAKEDNSKVPISGAWQDVIRTLPSSALESILNMEVSDWIAILHYSFFFLVVSTTFRMLRKEYLRASESYTRANEMLKDSEDKHSWQLGTEGEGALGIDDEVVSADLGKGRILRVLDNGMVQVEFENLTDTKLCDVKTLLYVGMRVKHGTRAWGTIELFDENDRVHVSFDSGEYHRYKFESWKRKMLSSPHQLRTLIHFRSFLYQYVLYRTDYTLTTFTFAKPLVLLLTTYCLIVVGASAYARVASKPIAESLWVAWTFVADPGTHADTEGTLPRVVALFLTLGGMLVFALMIGIIADGVSSLLDELKQGNSAVIEQGHTLVLGWSDKTLPLVREICLANESLGGGVVVILAERPKADMEREIMEDLPPSEAKGTLIICRSGNPTNSTDLKKVSAGSSKSVVVMADNKLPADESDARAVRAILSLQGIRRSKMGHVVVEMCDIDNRDLALLADSKNVEVVVAHDLIGRLMIQCAREPGLAQILEELLGFEGDEFYIKDWSGHLSPGTTFGEILFRFEDAIPLGIKPYDRKDAYQQLANSKWRKASLIRRKFDGTLPSEAEQQQILLDQDDFAMRQGSSDIPVIDHFSGRYNTDDVLDFSERQSREVILNPPNDYVLREKDEILVLAEDDDSYSPKAFSELPKSARQAFESMQEAHRPTVQARPEMFLFCGWRRDMDDMIMELDQLVGPGSEVTIMCNTPESERFERFEQGGLDVSKLKNLAIKHVMGNPILRRDLNRLPNKLETYHSVLILADQALETTTSSSDSRSLAALLLIRDMISKELKRKNGLLGRAHRQSSLLERAPSFSDSDTAVPSPRHDENHPRLTPVKEQSLLSGDGPVLETSLNDTSPPEASGSSPREPPSPVHISKAGRLASMGESGNSLNMPPSPSSGPVGSVSSRVARLTSMGESSSALFGGSKRDGNFFRRPSSVGQALFFENSHNTGSTVLISEILDSKTKALVPVAQIGDHVMSNEIVACTLAMVSECRDISVILNELLQADGNDLHVRSMLDYGVPGEKIDFWQLQARARARGEIAIGYKGMGDRTPTLNPREKCAKFTISAKGTVIVIAED